MKKKKCLFNGKISAAGVPFKRSGFAWLVIFVILGIHVFVAVNNTTVGVKIAALEDEIGVYQTENENLAKEVLNASSLSKLNEGAEEMGFGKIENTFYLKTGQAQAKAQ